MRNKTIVLLGLCIFFSSVVASTVSPSSAASGEPPKLRISGLFYFSYQHGFFNAIDQSKFQVGRAYVTTRAQIFPRLLGRVTFDTTQDHEGDGRGDMEVRLKYAFVKFLLGDVGFLHGLNLEGGIVHMVWLDFEEHINFYRMRNPMFMERSGIFNSGDFGITLAGLIGQPIEIQAYPETPDGYPGRYGSFAVGFYNGGGYHGEEMNTNKVVEGRLSLRPLPHILPGLQISGLAISGRGNPVEDQVRSPAWTTYCGYLSYQHRHFVLTGQYTGGRGNQKGTWFEPDDFSRATPFDGYAFFLEGRPDIHWRLIGGFDRFERESKAEDFGFRRWFAGLGYDFGRQNILLFDYDYRYFDNSSTRDERRYQLTYQMKF